MEWGGVTRMWRRRCSGWPSVRQSSIPVLLVRNLSTASETLLEIN